jgi:predicted acetyltransferase
MVTQPTLRAPHAGVRESFLTAMAEFAAEGRGGPDDDTMIGWETQAYGSTWSTVDGFAAYVEALKAQGDPATPRPADRVPCTTLWWSDDTEYLGRLAIRHRLTDKLRVLGGHIGYDVRPSARGKGYATAMLAAGLVVARELGIDEALLTVTITNAASRKVVERNGGVLDREAGDTCYYLIRT